MYTNVIAKYSDIVLRGWKLKMILPDEKVEENEVEVEVEVEENIYSKKARARLLENDEMSYEEEGFMEGYDLENDTNEK